MIKNMVVEMPLFQLGSNQRIAELEKEVTRLQKENNRLLELLNQEKQLRDQLILRAILSGADPGELNGRY